MQPIIFGRREKRDDDAYNSYAGHQLLYPSVSCMQHACIGRQDRWVRKPAAKHCPVPTTLPPWPAWETAGGGGGRRASSPATLAGPVQNDSSGSTLEISRFIRFTHGSTAFHQHFWLKKTIHQNFSEKTQAAFGPQIRHVSAYGWINGGLAHSRHHRRAWLGNPPRDFFFHFINFIFYDFTKIITPNPILQK
jgi:hypothetical protein